MANFGINRNFPFSDPSGSEVQDDRSTSEASFEHVVSPRSSNLSPQSSNPFLIPSDSSSRSSTGHFTVSFYQRSIVSRFRDFIGDLRMIYRANRRRRTRRRSTVDQPSSNPSISPTSSGEPDTGSWSSMGGSFTTSTPSSSTSPGTERRRRVTFILTPRPTDIKPRSHYPATPHPGVGSAKAHLALIGPDSGNYFQITLPHVIPLYSSLNSSGQSYR